MKLVFKKEVKHSVVYEATEDQKDPIVKSVYVNKLGMLTSLNWPAGGAWPKTIELEIKIP